MPELDGQHPNEGTIHAWLDGALDATESARLEGHVLWLDAPSDLVDQLSIELGRAGVAIRQLAREQRSLEDLFFRLTEDSA